MFLPEEVTQMVEQEQQLQFQQVRQLMLVEVVVEKDHRLVLQFLKEEQVGVVMDHFKLQMQQQEQLILVVVVVELVQVLEPHINFQVLQAVQES
tara:strand:- start:25 stop:306 length:282 start_codon:yes stop_codon:yes gene_type:complete